VQHRSALSTLIGLICFSTVAGAAEADPAAQAYERSLRSYAAGDVTGALESMRESYRLSGLSELLYNIARLEAEAGDCAASLADYREYLERVPEGQYREPALRATQELGARCPAVEETQPPVLSLAAATAEAAPDSAGAETPAPATPAPPPAPVARPKPARREDAAADTRRWLGWSAIAAGGLAGVGAIYFTVSAHEARSRFRSSLRGEVAGGPYADFSWQDEQHRDQRLAQLLAVTGGALVGGGVLLLALGGRTPASAGVTAGVWFEPRAISAQVSSRF
jgi:hypothetical protein